MEVAHHEVGDPTGPAGIGAVLRSESGEVIGEISTSIGVTTNTVADYAALIEGLQMALDGGVTELDVYIDSPVVAGHLLEEYGVRADHLRPLVEQARMLLDAFPGWSLTRVSRRLNIEADDLANRGIDDAAVHDLQPAQCGVGSNRIQRSRNGRMSAIPLRGPVGHAHARHVESSMGPSVV